MEFKIGDTVALKIDKETLMTIVEIDYFGTCLCKWLSKTGVVQQHGFPPQSLQLIE